MQMIRASEVEDLSNSTRGGDHLLTGCIESRAPARIHTFTMLAEHCVEQEDERHASAHSVHLHISTPRMFMRKRPKACDGRRHAPSSCLPDSRRGKPSSSESPLALGEIEEVVHFF
jgi:hypothetical protein